MGAPRGNNFSQDNSLPNGLRRDPTAPADGGFGNGPAAILPLVACASTAVNLFVPALSKWTGAKALRSVIRVSRAGWSLAIPIPAC